MAPSFVFFLFVLIHGCNSWDLDVAINEHNNTTNTMTLTCHYGNDSNDSNNSSQPRLKDVTRIAIYKYQSEVGDSRSIYANLYTGVNRAILDHQAGQNAHVNGQIDKTDNSYLKITWGNLTKDAFGKYSCVVSGFKEDYSLAQVETQPLSIVPVTEHDLRSVFDTFLDYQMRANQIHSIALSRLKAYAEMASKVNASDGVNSVLKMFFDNEEWSAQNRSQGISTLKALASQVQPDLKTFMGVFDDFFDHEKMSNQAHSLGISILKAYPAQQGSMLADTFEIVLKYFLDYERRSHQIHSQGVSLLKAFYASTLKPETLEWPSGSYAMVQTESGCPNTTQSSFKEGYLKLHTESGKYPNADNASDPMHVAHPIRARNNSRNFFYLRTCSRESGLNSSGSAWPRGSYCIHQVGSSCPTGFVNGTIGLDLEDSGFQDTVDVDGPDNAGVLNIRMTFCCREDGNHDEPVALPVKTPFFLYRFGGKCQEVFNAEVHNEWFTINTEETGNSDAVVKASHYVPDATLNPAHFYTCYYKGTI